VAEPEEEKIERRPLIRKSTKRILMRALWRSLPILPGPDIYDLFIDLGRSRKSIDEKINQALESLKDPQGWWTS
jgi:hypothetical protein